MINIDLTDDYRLSSDSRNLILQYRTSKKVDGEVVKSDNFRDLGYFHSFSGVASRLLEHKICTSTLTTLEHIDETISEVSRDMEEFIKPLLKEWEKNKK